MIKRISGCFVDWQIRKHYLQESERALYEYGYEVILNQAVNILIAVLISIIMKKPLAVVAFLVSYIPLRSYCGGYHARTHARCSVISAILLMGICYLEGILPQEADLLLVAASFLLSGILIFRYAPVEDSNKKLDEKEKCIYRKRGRAVWAVEAIVGVGLYIFNRETGLALALSHIVFSGTLWIGITRNKREELCRKRSLGESL